jgi:hypothetical protein
VSPLRGHGQSIDSFSRIALQPTQPHNIPANSTEIWRHIPVGLGPMADGLAIV